MINAGKYRQLFFSEKVPTLQNTVYANPEAAKHAQSGSINILQDKETGFAFNADFRENLMRYDQNYDNSVPSKAFMDYYDEIADYLVKNYDLRNGVVIDIGCGKGTFLSRLANRYDFVTGVGIDPSYDGSLDAFEGRLQFRKEHFTKEHIDNKKSIAIVICRHVLEHIPLPADFLREILKPLRELEDIPLFIEVPDLSWIIENNAFWDFCYEHINYFNHEALYNCITQVGANVSKISPSFGGQYIWAEARVNVTKERKKKSTGHSKSIKFQKNREREVNFEKNLKEVAEKIKNISLSKEIVIWGMATKGVMYSLHLINLGIDVSYCVDINERKQSKYCPLSGLEIQSPFDLQPNRDYAIICMNPNYAIEIELQCRTLGLNVTIYTPDGDKKT